MFCETSDVNILIVDDNYKSLFALEKFLKKKCDATIIKASSGNEALTTMLNHDFALIILDVQMPDMDGYEVLEIMRTNEATSSTPVIFLTAVYNDDEHSFKGYKAGAVDFIFKPVNEEVLFCKVKVFLELYQKRLALQKEIETRKKIEQRLKWQAQIIDQIHDAVISTDLDGVITAWNKGAERMFLYSEKEAVGKHVSFLCANFDDCYTSLSFPGLIEHIKEHGHYSAEGIRRKKDGKCFHVHISVSLLRNMDGDVIGTVGYSIDISKRKKVESELARSNLDLKQFAHLASHDLQEPIRMVGSYLELLKKKHAHLLDDEANEFIEYAVDGSKRMKNLIRDLLEYSQVGKGSKEFEKTDCLEVLCDALDNLKVAIEEKGAIITHDPLPVIMGDKVKLVQVFQNLIGNAIKFTKDKPPRIHISSEFRGNEWLLSFKDNGIGIEDKYKESIFTAFKRLHGKGVYPGSGIGLAICKKTVMHHGGRIWIHSEVNKGSTFYLTIQHDKALDSKGDN